MINKDDPLTKEQKEFLIKDIQERLKSAFDDRFIELPYEVKRSIRDTLASFAVYLIMKPNHEFSMFSVPLDCNASKDLKDFLWRIIKDETIDAIGDFTSPYCNDWELLAKEKTDESKGS